MREWEIGAVENIHGALPYIRFAPILALVGVGVGVNRIGKLGIRGTQYLLRPRSHHLPQCTPFGGASRRQSFANRIGVAVFSCSSSSSKSSTISRTLRPSEVTSSTAKSV